MGRGGAVALVGVAEATGVSMSMASSSAGVAAEDGVAPA